LVTHAGSEALVSWGCCISSRQWLIKGRAFGGRNAFRRALFKYVDLLFLQLLFMSRIPGELIDLIEGERYRAGERRGLDRR
jgi:hypothetical protein